ncbi:MAG TPA: DNA-processing protein DprA [Bacteroidota bacterium]|nr:DNA-processing protein DprA [Bacteroidota bacterium]
MTAKIRVLLALTQIPGIGPHRLRALVDHLHDPRAILDASLSELAAANGIDTRLARTIRAFSRGKERAEAELYADRQIAALERYGGSVVTLWEEAYPTGLKRIYDPPLILFARGTLSKDDDSSLAIVGTREPSPYGIRMAEWFAEEFARAGLTVVSGLARGIDTAAHSSTLRHGGRTVAIIGSGVDVLYPPENRVIAERMMSQGAVLSEFPMGTKPDAVNFPRRNRLISGMTLGTIVVETGTEGGALITAATALDQNREVFALPSSINPKRPSGTNRLIREGKALLVESVDEVLQELAPKLSGRSRPSSGAESGPREELSFFERAIVDVLPEGQTVHVDALASLAKMPVADVLVHLLSLEFKGVVRQRPGKYFIRA